MPHAQVTNRKFKKNELIVVDLTLRYKGYVSDATRTFAVGKISDEEKNVLIDTEKKYYDLEKQTRTDLEIATGELKKEQDSLENITKKLFSLNHYTKIFTPVKKKIPTKNEYFFFQ